MDKQAPSPPHTKKLDICIYNHLISRKMYATAQAFAEETQVTSYAPLLQSNYIELDLPKGFLSDWWSVFWTLFSSTPGDSKSEHLEGYAQEEKTFEAGDHFSLQEEQMQRNAASLANSNIMQQYPVADSSAYHRCLYCTPVETAAPDPMQQQYQPPTDGKCADDNDLSRDVSEEKTMGITIEEIFRVNASQKKIFCCSFSSDGDLLGSAGDENKVFAWNLRNNLVKYTWEAHSSFITDMSFWPKKTVLATASADKTVRLWDISQGGHSIQTFVGHSSLVRSVDFHPNADSSLLCSCDDSGKVLFWKIGQDKLHTSEATGRGKVRFDPTGRYIASVIGNTVNVTDIETDKRISCLQGNRDNKTVHSICWSEHFPCLCLASVSDDCIRVWPSQGGGPARELSGTNVTYFRSCSFHPKHPNTLVIGGYQKITLWNFAENKLVSVEPHDGYVADLAGCRATGMLASASHDGYVKAWR